MGGEEWSRTTDLEEHGRGGWSRTTDLEVHEREGVVKGNRSRGAWEGRSGQGQQI